MTLFQLIIHILISLIKLAVVLFCGIVSIVQTFISFIPSLFVSVINLFGFIPWLVPNCLLPLYYVTLSLYFINLLIKIMEKVKK